MRVARVRKARRKTERIPLMRKKRKKTRKRSQKKELDGLTLPLSVKSSSKILEGRSNLFRDKRHYKIIKISLCKETLAVLGANQGRHKKGKGGKEDNSTSFSKFKGADHIYSRILWDKSLKREEFSVGYEDRFLGILEIPFMEFS